MVCLLNELVLQQADTLLEKYRAGQPKALHSLEALRLASTLIARQTLSEHERAGMVFVSADRQLRGCAQAEGSRCRIRMPQTTHRPLVLR
jgi:hypothetical protein